MSTELAIINTEFGLKQLSDNESLYKKLLLRFFEEYQQSGQTLAEFKQQNNHDAMHLHVHTIKGVSGNLGLDYLHSVAKNTDEDVKANGSNVDIDALVSALTKTIAAIDTYCNGSSASTEAPTRSEGTEALRQALVEKRFISDEQVTECLADSSLSQEQKQNIQDAIDDLDYDLALSILPQ
ncbi:Hpt domain-containing protein [Alteromonas facilis]|uniref:Hpt domain-containing protein n=1 Tax=Alteromonas facilis TaxID=2048004 RepID=UPI000F5D17E9|nr:Hpt domain-containing protein [Alteromonas facilis]